VGELTEALRRLHEAGKIKSQWLVGMSWSGLLCVEVLGSCAYLRAPLHPCEVVLWQPEVAVRSGLSPDLTDPCTVGGLLALYREAVGDRLASVEPAAVFQGDDYTGPWTTVRWDGPGWVHGPDAPTEGGALAAALVDLAARVSP
jgi:hypothetical protein